MVSTVSVVETKMVLFGHHAVVMIEDFLTLRRFEITPPRIADLEAAFDAFPHHAKGNEHQASLNFNDVAFVCVEEGPEFATVI